MPVEEVLLQPQEVLDIILELGNLGRWVQAVGLLVILWIVVQIINLFFNRRRRLAIYEIRDDLKRVERKLDRLSKEASK
jgi:purine-cytosine permease-like protein